MNRSSSTDTFHFIYHPFNAPGICAVYNFEHLRFCSLPKSSQESVKHKSTITFTFTLHTLYEVNDTATWDLGVVFFNRVSSHLPPLPPHRPHPALFIFVRGSLNYFSSHFSFIWSIHPSMDQSIDPSIHPSIHPSIIQSIYPLIDLSIDRSMHWSINPSIHRTIHPSIHRWTKNEKRRNSRNPSLFLFQPFLFQNFNWVSFFLSFV